MGLEGLLVKLQSLSGLPEGQVNGPEPEEGKKELRVLFHRLLEKLHRLVHLA